MRLPRLPYGALRLMAHSRTKMWVIACSSAAAAFVAVCLVALIATHAATERRTENAASATASLASYDVAQIIGQYDRALQTVVDRAQSPELNLLGETARNLVLFDRATGLPGLAFINVLDENGRVISSPGSVGLGSSWQGRDYFTAHRTNTSLGAFFGRLFGQDDYAGVTISRRLSHPDGTFAGVAVAGLRLQYLREMLERFPLGLHGSITLQRNDGTILMRRPYDRNDIGRIPASQSQADRSDEAIAVRQLGDLPLSLRVTVPAEDLADSTQRWISVLLNISLVVAALSGILVLALHREIKQREAAEQDNRNKSDYLAMASHEFRTPLHSILGNADLLRADTAMDADNRRHLAAIVGASHHLRNVIDRVLNHLQIETRVPSPRMAWVDLVALVDECCIIVESEIATRGLNIHYGFKVDAPEQFVTDGDLLRQVLLSLIGNAIKFTKRGDVSIEVGGSEGRITVEVKDTGSGIPHDQRHKLFQQGERLGAERTAVPGHGIGLAMAKRLIQAMGGEIGYRDNAPQGSIFWIGLPAGNAADGPAQAPMSEGPAAVALRVLLVDDVPDSREFACVSLKEHGHVVSVACNGAEASELAGTQSFDVVVLDMDGINGFEVAELIRKGPGKRGPLPIVAMISDAIDQRIIAVRSFGIMHHLVKPFSAHELVAMVDRVARHPPVSSADAHSDAHEPAPMYIGFDDVQQRLIALTRKVELLLAELGHLDGTEGDAAAGELACDVASLARLFGLQPLADAAGRFADAAEAHSAMAGDLAHALEAAARSTLPELRELAVSGAL